MIWGILRLYVSPRVPSVIFMDNPSDSLLSVFAGVLRRMKQTELVRLLERFQALGEHPAAIAIIEFEIQNRSSSKARIVPQPT